MGVYEWLRVPMGLKGAGSYFQEKMATIVLAGLVYINCELYLDDVLVYAKTEQEFLDNLRTIFERFRKFNVTLNPDKCELGLSQVEFVGHLLNSEGLSFTKDKKSNVENFSLPEYKKQLKSFLGLGNYFRNHVRNHSLLVYPLQQMLMGYSKAVRNNKLSWTPELIKQFEVVKEAVGNCQTLRFVDHQYPLYLQTDASDYGIGAYLFQKIFEEDDHPIMFISKSLNKQQLRWSTPEKECYAIVNALQKMEHFLRDTHFILQTDHNNLTRIYTTGSPKVLRWKLLIQEFSFTIEHLPGVDNVVADNFSRLCPISDTVEYLALMGEVELVAPLATSCDEIVELTEQEFRKIPKKIYKQISDVHNSVAGHHGVSRTLGKLSRSGVRFDNMRETIRQFIAQCPCCQKMSQIKVPIHTSPFTLATYTPMTRINFDYMGPYPPDDDGKRFILVVIDTCTRFVELYATKAANSSETARAHLQHVGRYGTPTVLLVNISLIKR